MDWLSQGGWVLWGLFALSVLSIGYILMIAARLYRLDVKITAEALMELLREQQPQARQVLFAGVVAAASRFHVGMTAEQQQQALTLAGLDTLNDLRGGLRLLEVVAGAAPLIGLLGTVLGMVEAFQQLEAAGSRVDPALLSGGIWQALLTTAAGLLVALPALFAWHAFDRRLEVARLGLNQAIALLITGVPSSAGPREQELVAAYAGAH